MPAYINISKKKKNTGRLLGKKNLSIVATMPVE